MATVMRINTTNGDDYLSRRVKWKKLRFFLSSKRAKYEQQMSQSFLKKIYFAKDSLFSILGGAE